MAKYQVMELGKENNKVIFLLSGWNTKLWMMWPFVKFLETRDFHVIAYSYSRDILSPDVLKTKNDIIAVKNDILKRISLLKKEIYVEISIFGISLGSVIAVMVANESPSISKIILNTIGSNLAEVIWRWEKKINPYFMEQFISKKIDLPRLKHGWSEISPDKNVENLKNKKTLIFLAEKDKIIPFDLGLEFVNMLKAKNPDIQVRVGNMFGHTISVFLNLLNFPVYLKFLGA